MKLRQRHHPPYRYRFDWRENNGVVLHIDGAAFIPRLLGAIDTARHFILIEMYLFESGQLADRIIHALIQAAERGVTVYLLLDDFGAHLLNDSDRQRLQQSNIALHFYNPVRFKHWWHNIHRDHRKLILIDDQFAMVGGLGIKDEFDPTSGKEHYWRETVVEINGPALTDLRTLFVENWQRQSEQTIHLPTRISASANVTTCRVIADRVFPWLEVNRALIKQARSAQGRIWLSTPYFAPARKLRRALTRAARRGIDVRLLLSGPSSDHPSIRQMSHRYYGRLLRHGVRIFEYQPRFIHSKAALCDRWVTFGSSNFDRWSIGRNLELNIEIRNDESLLEQTRAMFERDFEQSQEILYRDWLARPWYQRLTEWLLGIVDRWFTQSKQRF